MNTRQLAIAALKMEAEACPDEKVISGMVSMTFKELRDSLEHDNIPPAIESGVVAPFMLSLQRDPKLRRKVLEQVNGRK